MNYWLIAIPREDMDHCLKIGCYGRNAPAKLLPVEPGDKIACYVSRESKIVALGEVIRGYYQDSKKIFRASRPSQDTYSLRWADPPLFPHRIDFTAQQLEEEIDFRPLIDKLSFIKKPEYWPAYIRRGFAQMSEQDWREICKAVKKSNK